MADEVVVKGSVGIDKTREALKDIAVVAKDLKDISAGGLTGSDLFSVPGLIKDSVELYQDAEAAYAAGEITDLDWSEIKTLYDDAASLLGDLLKSVA